MSEEFEHEGEEETEVEVIELSLTEDGINEWIEQLTELRETKELVTLELDDENELQLSYEEASEDDEDEEEEE